MDREHTYGHQKIEYVSSGFEGVLILVAAGGIVWYSIQRLLHPQELDKIDLGTPFSSPPRSSISSSPACSCVPDERPTPSSCKRTAST